jgi:transketolase N-terminal domain/subunit
MWGAGDQLEIADGTSTSAYVTSRQKRLFGGCRDGGLEEDAIWQALMVNLRCGDRILWRKS